MVTYPRNLTGVVRKKDERRKAMREAYAQRKAAEATAEQEQVKRLKSLKRREIDDRSAAVPVTFPSSLCREAMLQSLVRGVLYLPGGFLIWLIRVRICFPASSLPDHVRRAGCVLSTLCIYLDKQGACNAAPCCAGSSRCMQRTGERRQEISCRPAGCPASERLQGVRWQNAC